MGRSASRLRASWVGDDVEASGVVARLAKVALWGASAGLEDLGSAEGVPSAPVRAPAKLVIIFCSRSASAASTCLRNQVGASMPCVAIVIASRLVMLPHRMAGSGSLWGFSAFSYTTSLDATAW